MATAERPLRRGEWVTLATGFYSSSRGAGIALGPALAGLAIQVAETDYRAMWLVGSAAIVASIPFARRLRHGGEPKRSSG